MYGGGGCDILPQGKLLEAHVIARDEEFSDDVLDAGLGVI
jgi:hypothetical protein